MPLNTYKASDEDIEVLAIVTKVAEAHPNLPLGEYFRIYNPLSASNECCYKCWKASRSGCSWAKRFELVEGSIAENINRRNDHKEYEAFKIFFCPEWQSDDQMPEEVKKEPYNEDGCVNALCAIAKEIAEDYRYTLNEIKRFRILYNYQDARPERYGRKKIEETLTKIYDLLRHKQDIEQNILPAHCDALKRQVNYIENKIVDSVAIKFIEKRKR